MSKTNIEEWRNVNGYEDIYQVSSKGRIKRVNSGKILKDYVNSGGYRITTLSRNSVVKTVYTHMLVAEAFLGQNICCSTCGQKMEINHKDRNKNNNHFNNLEYVSHAENMKLIRENRL